MMRTRYLGWFTVGLLISIAGAVVYAVATRACQRPESEAEPAAMVAEPQPVA